MNRARTAIVGSLLVLVAVVLMGWQRPVMDEVESTITGCNTTGPVAVMLRGCDCSHGRLDIGPRMVDGATAFSCNVSFSQLDAMVTGRFHARIMSNAFVVEMWPCRTPSGRIGVTSHITLCGGPSQGTGFFPAPKDPTGTVDLEVTVCCGRPGGETAHESGGQHPPGPRLAWVSVGGLSRYCAQLDPWAEAGWPVTFEFGEVATSSYQPGHLVEFCDIRFAGSPAECCGLTQTLSQGRHEVMLVGTSGGFALAVVE